MWNDTIYLIIVKIPIKVDDFTKTVPKGKKYRKERKKKASESFVKRGMAVLIITIAIIFTLIPVPAEAAGSVKMNTYSEVIKSGNIVFCAGKNGIYMVKLKRGKAVKAKRLVNKGSYVWISSMRYSGDYIYYIIGGFSPSGPICRVNIKNGKIQRLTKTMSEPSYVINNYRLYYSRTYGDDGNRIAFVAKLNGESPKRTNVRIINPEKRSNAKGYSIRTVHKGRTNYDYLRTPKGSFYLGKGKSSYYY